MILNLVYQNICIKDSNHLLYIHMDYISISNLLLIKVLSLFLKRIRCPKRYSAKYMNISTMICLTCLKLLFFVFFIIYFTSLPDQNFNRFLEIESKSINIKQIINYGLSCTVKFSSAPKKHTQRIF